MRLYPTLNIVLLVISAMLPPGVCHAAHTEKYDVYLTAPDSPTGSIGYIVTTCLAQSYVTTYNDCIQHRASTIDLGNGWTAGLYHYIQIYNGGTWRDMPFDYDMWHYAATNGPGKNRLHAEINITYKTAGHDKPTKPIWWCAETHSPSHYTYPTCTQIMGQGYDIPDPVVPASCTVMNDTTMDLGTITVGVPLAKEKKVSATLNCNMDTTMKVEYICDDPGSEYCVIKSMTGVTHTVSLSGSQTSTGAAKNGDKITMTTGDNHLVITDSYTGTPSVSGVYRGSGLIQTTYE